MFSASCCVIFNDSSALEMSFKFDALTGGGGIIAPPRICVVVLCVSHINSPYVGVDEVFTYAYVFFREISGKHGADSLAL